MTRTTRIALVIALAALVALAGASSASAMTVLVRQGDSGRTLQLRPGDVVKLSLAENPSTGYGWHFRRRPNRRVLRLTSSRFVADPAPPGTVGVGGKHEWTFKARARGRTAFRLWLTPPGQREMPTRRFGLRVRVS